MESDLELNHAARQALASATQEAQLLQSSLDPKLELKRLKLMINQTISNQSMKMDVLLNALRRKVAAVEEKNKTLELKLAQLKATGKTTLNNKIKQIRKRV